MGTTAKYAIPYPELTDPPDGPAQIKAVADRVEALITPLDTLLSLYGNAAVTITNASSASMTVTFAKAFAGVPFIGTNINTNAGALNTWQSRAQAVTTTGCTIILAGSATVSLGVNCQWQAVGYGSMISPATKTVPIQDAPDGWHEVTATCHTAGCPKDNEPVAGILVPDDPAEWGWTGISCGVCGQPITDIVPS